MPMLFKNDWGAVLQSDVSQGETVWTIDQEAYDLLEDIVGDDYYVALFYNGASYEYLRITARLEDNKISVVRGLEGSSALVGRSGDVLSVVNSAGQYQLLNQHDSPIQVNARAVRSPFFIMSGYNAHSVGPLDVESVVDISPDSVWDIS